MHFFNKSLLTGCIQFDNQLLFTKDGQFVFTKTKAVIQVGIVGEIGVNFLDKNNDQNYYFAAPLPSARFGAWL